MMSATIYKPNTIVSVELKSGRLEVIRRYPSNMAYCSGVACPDHIVKEVYGCTDGISVELIETKEGIHVPKKVVEEQFIFEK